ncbi:MAG: SufD family Fe-S cluster assembly protein, partial [Saccharofermentans sp.]|nr:SufD family Fe-S cluster assembly protein [Saccharofermentans sp.]
MDDIEKRMLKEVAELDSLPVGAFNIRSNGQSAARNSTANIEIVSKTDKSGIDIIIKDGTKNESCHIPVIISKSGVEECVYNDFYVGKDCDVTIVAGCGISNCGGRDSRHDGIHTFHIEKDAHVRYIEKHYGEGTGTGKRLMNPTTEVNLGEGAVMEMDTSQIAGINDTYRITRAVIGP